MLHTLFLYFCMFFFSSQISAASDKLSRKLTFQILSYHKQHKDFIPFGFSWPNIKAEKWEFQKKHLTQYLVDRKAVLEYAGGLITKYQQDGKLTDEERTELLNVTSNRMLEQAITRDLEAEHHYHETFDYSQAGINFLAFLKTLEEKDDPIPLLISLYSLYVGNSFGVKHFMERGAALGLAKSLNTASAFSDDEREALKKNFQQIIDCVDDRIESEKGKRLDRHKQYREFTKEYFIVEGFAIDVLAKANVTGHWSEEPTPFWILNVLRSMGIHKAHRPKHIQARRPAKIEKTESKTP